MKNLNLIGLDKKQADQLATDLNELLANFQMHYQNLRALHWNIRGNNFFELHIKFEELYLDAQEKVDLVAERILTLGNVPAHAFSDYLTLAKIKEEKNVHEDRKAVEIVLNSFGILLQLERNLLAKAGELDDEGTSSMLSDFITEQEKTVWMLNAWTQQSFAQ